MTYGYLRADYLYTGISSGPNARYRVWESLLAYRPNRLSSRIRFAKCLVPGRILNNPAALLEEIYSQGGDFSSRIELKPGDHGIKSKPTVQVKLA